MFVDVLWQSTLLLGSGLVVARLLRAQPARAHAVLCGCMGIALAAPGFTHLAGALGLGLFDSHGMAPAAGLLPPDGSVAISGGLSRMELLQRVALLLWAVVSGILLLRLSLQLLQAHVAALRLGSPADERVVRQVEAVRGRSGLRRSLVVLVADPSHAPAVWGWARPARLFLPSEMEPAGLRAILHHELAHLRRRDHWSTLLTQLVVCALPWQPLAWLAHRRSGALAEEACDGWALAAGVAPTVMAETLLSSIPSRAALGLPLKRDRVQLESRIERLFAAEQPRAAVGRAWAHGLGLILMGVLTGLALGQPAPTTLPEVPAGSPEAAEWSRRIVALRAAGTVDLVVQPGEVDLGLVAPGSTARGSLWLLNPGTEAREVLGAKASCGCTRVTLPVPAIVPAGGVLELPVEMDAPEEPDVAKTKVVTLRLDGQAPLQIPVMTRTRGESPPRSDP